MIDIKKQARLAILLALSVILSLVESIIPIFNGFIPGMKIGFANIVILFVLYKYTLKEAILLSILRVFLVAILISGLFTITFAFSLTGAILSGIIMGICKHFTKLSIIGVSTMGSISHSMGQLLIAYLFLANNKIFYYFPFLLLLSTITGICIGIITVQSYKRISNI